MSGIIRIGRKYQVVIPREIRKRLALREGDEMIYENTPNGVFIYPKPANPVAFMRGLGAGLWNDENVDTYLKKERDSWDR